MLQRKGEKVETEEEGLADKDVGYRKCRLRVGMEGDDSGTERRELRYGDKWEVATWVRERD